MFLPPRGVYGLRFADVEDAEPNRRVGVVESEGEELILPVVDDGDLAEFSRSILRNDAVGEQPRMP